MTDQKNIIKLPTLTPVQDVPAFDDLRALLDDCAERFRDDDAFILKTRRASKGSPALYRHISYPEFRRDIDDLALGLRALGFSGKRLAVIGKNSYTWLLAYYAQLCGAGICIPLDKDLPFEELAASLRKSEADILVFGKEHQKLAEEAAAGGFEGLTFMAMERPETPFPAEKLLIMEDVMARGKNASEEERAAFRAVPIDRDALAVILFTSGTSGSAKAVMLSQYNICFDEWSTLCCEDVRHGDVNIAFLPFHHSFGSTGQTLMLAAGTTTVFCDGLKYIQANLQEYGVSVFVGVPLIIEAMYKKIKLTAAKQGREKKLEFGLKLSAFLMKLGIDRRRSLFRDVLDQLGGKLRYIVSGASPLDAEAANGFIAMGINVVQGYGMTECSPVIAAENPKAVKGGTIGKAIIGIEAAIEDPNEEGIGELIAKGPNVMLGYYKDEDATNAVLRDGWMHTGDLASLGKDGMISIRGRKKDVIVLKNGKNIYPEEIEQLIASLPYVKENMVFGELRNNEGDRKDMVLSVRIVYDKDAAGQTRGAVTEEEIYEAAKRDIDAVNDQLPKYKHIYRVYVTDVPMEKTTTGKIKRYKWRSEN